MVFVPLIEIKCSVCGEVWIPDENEISECPNCDSDLVENHPKVPKPWWKGGGAVIEKSEKRYVL